MLELKNITKDYAVAGGTVRALKGVSLKFRKSEFVSILGASGCGKTTLLNIIGGLDKYTSGDLVIEGRSTKEYKDGDWDTYRNHSIGFIFQSYHLIPHQTILQNVELALMISGVGKEERRRRAIEALGKVGLADKTNVKPNQLSGGQAQRVAIARALINDPEIVLADEPTGALDSKTSVQIMELLKEIAKDRLVIMVTHNPELAEKYSTRIIRLLDGEVTDDTMPYDGFDGDGDGGETTVERSGVFADDGQNVNIRDKTPKSKKKKAAMPSSMAFGLSLKNLLSKGKRTTMVSVAGSIGIIGVSLVLAISAGVQNYIRSMEDDMLSGYPLAVTETAIDYNALMDASASRGADVDWKKVREGDKVYVDSLLETLMNFSGSLTANNITEDYEKFVTSMPSEYYHALQYGYDFDMSNYVYTRFNVGDAAGTSYNASVTAIRAMYTSVLEQQEKYKDYAAMISTVSSLAEIPDNYDYILSQYDVLATYGGKTENLTESELKDIFGNKDSLIMVIDENAFSDLNFGQYGYMTEEEFLNFAFIAEGSVEYEDVKDVVDKYNGLPFEYFIGDNAHSFKWYPNDSIYSADDDFYMYYKGALVPASLAGYETAYRYNPYSDDFADEGIDLKVKIILQKKEGISYGCLESGLYYTKALTDYTIETGLKSQIAEHFAENESLEWLPYNYTYTYKTATDGEYMQASATSCIYKTGNFLSSMFTGGSIDQSEIYKVNASMVAASGLPKSFYIYPVSFDEKQLITDYLDLWNRAATDGVGTLIYTAADGSQVTVDGLTEADKVTYTDTVGLIISMVNTMIEMITIALVAFTALSLVVSTVMVGIITYVSVVERIKEIGILRSVGARKKDIKRLFNAETFIIGLAAGIVGIAVTYIISLILNLIIGSLYGIYSIAALPVWQALIMICISVALTLISGLIPASAAAKKDPVVALRTE